MSSVITKAKESALTRRSFIKSSVAVAATLSLGAHFSGCTPPPKKEAEATERVDNEVGGTWIAASCWHNCGSKCLNKVLVKEGVVVRQKTDDTHEDSEEHPQQRSCLRGRSQQQQCFGADRLKYPMKRKTWEPITGGNRAMRGKDEWVRISWDEASKLIANEITHIYQTYGPRSVLAFGGSTAGVARVLTKVGGFVGVTDTSSLGTYCLDTTKLGIMPYDLSPDYTGWSANDRFDMKNADWIVFQGCNPGWASAGNPMYYYYKAKEAGVQFVMIGPSFNATAQMLDARWIPVRTGTDTAFMIAVAYEMLKLDEVKKNIIDWDFLNTYTVGFDADHMPADATVKENFKDYLLGAYDGIPKTAEWATDICGTPPADIRWYAELLGKNNKITLHHSMSFARNHGAEDVPQMYMTLGAMGGHFGKPGHSCGATYCGYAANCGPRLASAGGTGLPGVPNPVTDLITAQLCWDSIKKKRYRYIGAFTGGLRPYEDRDIDIHMIYHEASASLATKPHTLGGIEVHRMVDFVLTSASFLTTQAKYSDIVLPITTQWERVGSLAVGGREAVFVNSKVTDPLFESKSDQDAGKSVAKALGLDVDALYPISEKQQFFNQLLGATYIDTSKKSAKLVTITEEDIRKWECTGEPQQGIIDLDEFIEKGCFSVKRSPGDSYNYIAYEEFIKDPIANKRTSVSGKFEIYCQGKADLLKGIGFTDEFKPYPSYIPAVEGWETTFSDFKNKVKGEYPFNVYNPHYLRRVHTSLDNSPWLRETWPNPVFINPIDANSKGIKTGDTVVVYNRWGKVLRTASLVDLIMPGMIGLPHGSWIELDAKEEYDLSGADSVLCGPIVSGMGVTAYNNHNCNIAKYTGTPLKPDAEWPQRIIDYK